MTDEDRTGPSASSTAADAARSGRTANGEGRSWLALALGAGFIVLVAVVFSYIMSERPTDDAPVGAFDAVFADGFDRPADSAGLNGEDVDDWIVRRGGWATEVGAAYLATPDGDRSIAVVDADATELSISARVSGRDLCGVVAGLASDTTYISLVRVGAFGVWNVEAVVDGTTTVIGTLPDVGEQTVGVALSVGDDVVTATVGFSTATFVGHGVPLGEYAGLIAYGADVACAWDDVVVSIGS